MIKLTFRPQALYISLPLLVLIASNHANAEIYKWRDSRGVTQYSDRPPVSHYSKVTRNELVNALQTKDLCTVGPIIKKVSTNTASNENQSGFFSKLIRSAPTARLPISSQQQSTAAVLAAKNVTVLGIAARAPSPSVAVTAPAVNPPPTPAAPVVNTPAPVPVAPPVSAAPAAPVLPAPPTQVATNNPSPTPTTPNSNPNIVQVGLMPAVDISKNMKPVVGFDVLKISPTTQIAPSSRGDFRIHCQPSHMSNDDPIIYPNQQGAAHHHTFFGNVSVNYKSNLMALSSTGNSTCSGGIMNRSAYWVPSMIDISSNAPIVPDFSLFYYKTDVDGALVKPPPKGLRMIAGNSKSTDSSDSSGQYTCLPPDGVSRPFYGWTKHIPACAVGDTMQMAVGFPQCWDGKNLDSPNHKDHMANSTGGSCPSTHPVPLPQVSVILNFKVNSANQTTKWRLASDNYNFNGKNAGYSAHADWVNGWDEAFMAGIVKNCLNAKKDAHAHLLCDGRMFY